MVKLSTWTHLDFYRYHSHVAHALAVLSLEMGRRVLCCTIDYRHRFSTAVLSLKLFGVFVCPSIYRYVVVEVGIRTICVMAGSVLEIFWLDPNRWFLDILLFTSLCLKGFFSTERLKWACENIYHCNFNGNEPSLDTIITIHDRRC